MTIRQNLAVLAASLMAIISTQALAHVSITASSIEDGATLSQAPEELTFSFGGDVRLVALTVSGPGMEDEDLSFQPDDGFAADYEAALPALGTGSFEIEWRAMAKDGHVMLGTIAFDIEA